MEIKKKIWPDSMKEIEEGRKLEIRLADFELAEGDTLVLEEYDPESEKYTGRKVKAKVGKVHLIDIAKFYTPEAVEENGLYVIELTEIEK